MVNDNPLRFLPVDVTLTSQTAHIRGYRWIFDVLPGLPDNLVKEIVKLVKEDECKLGMPADDGAKEDIEVAHV